MVAEQEPVMRARAGGTPATVQALFYSLCSAAERTGIRRNLARGPLFSSKGERNDEIQLTWTPLRRCRQECSPKRANNPSPEIAPHSPGSGTAVSERLSRPGYAPDPMLGLTAYGTKAKNKWVPASAGATNVRDAASHAVSVVVDPREPRRVPEALLGKFASADK